MTPPEHDVFLDASRDDERRGRLAYGRGQYLALTARIHRQRPDRRRFCSWYPGLLERFSGHVVPDRQNAASPAQPGGPSKIFDCDDNIANYIVNNIWPGYGPSQ
jgi:hypothetical protein